MDELQFEKLGFRSKLVQVFTGKPEEWKQFKVKLQAALEESDLLETLESDNTGDQQGRTFRGFCHVCSGQGHKAVDCPRVMK